LAGIAFGPSAFPLITFYLSLLTFHLFPFAALREIFFMPALPLATIVPD